MTAATSASRWPGSPPPGDGGPGFGERVARVRGGRPAPHGHRHRDHEGWGIFAAAFQARVHRAGDGTDQGVVHGGPPDVSGRTDRLKIGAGHGHPAPRASGRQQGTGPRAADPSGPRRLRGAGRAAQQPGEPGQGPHRCRERVRGELRAGRGGDREWATHRWRCPVEQGTQDRQPTQAVGERMLHHDHQRDPSTSQPGEEAGRPQRAVHRQRAQQQLRRGSEHGRLVTRRWAGHDIEMPVHRERGVIDPDRPATPGRHTHDALTQPRHSPDASRQQPDCFRGIERAARLDDQDDTELLGDRRALQRQEHQVSRTRPLDPATPATRAHPSTQPQHASGHEGRRSPISTRVPAPQRTDGGTDDQLPAAELSLPTGAWRA